MKQEKSNSVHFRSNGKLMLTGEYLVLNGAWSLALPTKLGQGMGIRETEEAIIYWNAQVKGATWFSAQFSIPDITIISSNLDEVSQTLQQILLTAKQLNPDFLTNKRGYVIDTNLDFDLNWGLGSSSSLISNIAYWANCDPYELNRRVFKGSGYDIACARSDRPVLYRIKNNGEPEVMPVNFNPPFVDQLFFVWLNQKQNTREGINSFNKQVNYTHAIDIVNSITRKMVLCRHLDAFQYLMEEHEDLMAKLLNIPKVKDRLFPDFEGAVKSLGAWGGDFVLVASDLAFAEVKNYFKQKGYNTVFQYSEIVR